MAEAQPNPIPEPSGPPDPDSPQPSDFFAKDEYNYCAIQKIKDKDNLEKLRHLYWDLEKLTFDGQDGPFSPKRLAGLSDAENESLRGRTMGELLGSKETTVAQLRALKTYSKFMMLEVMPAETQRVGAIVYLAAICQALVHHGEKITALSFEEMGNCIRAFLEKPYLVSSFEDLFKEALKKC